MCLIVVCVSLATRTYISPHIATLIPPHANPPYRAPRRRRSHVHPSRGPRFWRVVSRRHRRQCHCHCHRRHAATATSVSKAPPPSLAITAAAGIVIASPRANANTSAAAAHRNCHSQVHLPITVLYLSSDRTPTPCSCPTTPTTNSPSTPPAAEAPPVTAKAYKAAAPPKAISRSQYAARLRARPPQRRLQDELIPGWVSQIY